MFYYICLWLFVYETDEVLVFHKGAFEQNASKFTPNDITNWNTYNTNVEIVPDMGLAKDSIFGDTKIDPVSNDSEPYRVIMAPVTIHGKRFTYIERINLIVMEGMVASVAIMFLLIIIILLTGIIIWSKRSAARIWKPFYNTLCQIQNFEIDKNQHPKFIPTDIEEFDSLNKSLEKLIETNTAIYNNQREFVENAAHELQTPLALFQTKIDTLLQSPTLNEEQSAVLDSLNKDVSRFNRLNKNLLLLSKIENDTYLEKQQLNLNTYIDKHLSFFKEQAAAKNITVATNFEQATVLYSNPVLTEVLINNLFLNAIRHNVLNGKILITTTPDTISFINTGREGALNTVRLFNRFSKSAPSETGNGLGLAIIKKIAEINHWQIAYSYENNLHNFKVTF